MCEVVEYSRMIADTLISCLLLCSTELEHIVIDMPHTQSKLIVIEYVFAIVSLCFMT